MKENHLAIDIFNNGLENADKSGVVGNKDIFYKNGTRQSFNMRLQRIVQKDSLSLSSTSIKELYGKDISFSFFSVDGAHHKDYVSHDFDLALNLTHNDGIIIIDDYTNPRWHCVQEVVAWKYFTGSPKFVPVAFSCNKLFLCHQNNLATYRSFIKGFIKKFFPDTVIFETERYGYEGLTILPNVNNKLAVPKVSEIVAYH